MKKVKIKVLLAIYWALLFLGTHWPQPPGDFKSGTDKILHFSAFMLLTMLFRAVRSDLNWIQVAAVVICYAIFDETSQILVPGRSFELLDLAADCLGVMFAWVCLMVFRSLFAGKDQRI